MAMNLKERFYFTGLFFALLIGGAISSLIFPPFQNMLWGYVALVLFLAYLLGAEHSKKKLFWSAYCFGATFYIVGFSWINNALLIDSGKFEAFIPLLVLAVGAFFGLFWAIPAVFSVYGKQNIYSRALIFCIFYVLWEWVRSFIFTGVPWNLLGSALSFDVRYIQGAAWIGTYGLSLVLLLLLCGIAILISGGWQKRFYKGSLLFILLPLLFIYATTYRYHQKSDIISADKLVVRLVQPSIPQTFKWQPESLYKNFRTYIDLSKKGSENGYLSLDEVDLVVWGETATPYFLDRDEVHRAEIKEAIPQGGFLATGILRLTMEKGEIVPYNSLFVLNDEGEIKDYYDKAHLVPFGEYLPFREHLPSFMKPVADIVGTLGKGEKYKNIRVDGLPLMGGAICYESIFPKEVLNPQEKPEVLLVLANDGWYGISSGPYQHLAAAQMRAVEEGVTVIRSANNGISAVIAANGEILGKIDLDKAEITDVAISKPLSLTTFYGKYGNVIPLGLTVLLLIVALALSGYFNRKNIS